MHLKYEIMTGNYKKYKSEAAGNTIYRLTDMDDLRTKKKER